MVRDLTEKENAMVINFGAFAYPPSKIAILLHLSEKEIVEELKNPQSSISLNYNKGVYMADYVLDLKLFEMAQSGDLKAMEEFEYRKEKRK